MRSLYFNPDQHRLVAPLRRLLDAGDDAGLADMLVREIDVLAGAGAALAIIAANTPHMVFDRVQPRAANTSG